MDLGILGTGVLARALGSRWLAAGHDIAIAGRSMSKAKLLAENLGEPAHAVGLDEITVGRDAILLAVSWGGVEDILASVNAGVGALDGVPLIDPTNAIEHGVGVLLTDSNSSGAQRIAELAPGARVVKAFNLYPSGQWEQNGEAATVVMCGDEANALQVVGELVRDVGAVPAVLGPLSRARQLEEAAGFVIGLAFSGYDPRSAVPGVPG